jgi:hypothetical protein
MDLPQKIDFTPNARFALQIACFDAMLADVNLDNSGEIPADLVRMVNTVS